MTPSPGSLSWQYAFSSWLSTDSQKTLEHASVYGQVGMYVLLMGGMQYFQIRSAYLFAGLAVTGLLGIYGSEISSLIKGRPQTAVDFWIGYILLSAVSVLLGVEAVTSVGDGHGPADGGLMAHAMWSS